MYNVIWGAGRLINKYSNIPLYSQLKNLIVEKIENGEYAEGSKIPSEEELCELYKISRPTIRQAINELVSNGYLFRDALLEFVGNFTQQGKPIDYTIENRVVNVN